MAKLERSCGVVVYVETSPGQREYLLLHYPNGHWDFPKGHVEKGETQIQAALREVREETGFQQVEVHQGFRHVFDYYYHRERARYHKEVTYFVGRVSDRTVTLSVEHQGYVWLPYVKALERITYENAKELLVKAEAFLGQAKAAGSIKSWF